MSNTKKGSWRRSDLPPNWSRIRLAILERDGYKCQGIRHGGRICLMPANEVDHIDGHENHSPENLQALCRTCHGRKTQQEAEAAKNSRYKRPAEIHPFFR